MCIRTHTTDTHTHTLTALCDGDKYLFTRTFARDARHRQIEICDTNCGEEYYCSRETLGGSSRLKWTDVREKKR